MPPLAATEKMTTVTSVMTTRALKLAARSLSLLEVSATMACAIELKHEVTLLMLAPT